MVVLLAIAVGCSRPRCNRKDPRDTSVLDTGQFGDTGSTHKAQCSGWFPDWIVDAPPGDRATMTKMRERLSRERLREVPANKLRLPAEVLRKRALSPAQLDIKVEATSTQDLADIHRR